MKYLKTTVIREENIEKEVIYYYYYIAFVCNYGMFTVRFCDKTGEA